MCCAVLSHFSHVWLFVTSWTAARQAPLSMGFSRQEYWSGLPSLFHWRNQRGNKKIYLETNDNKNTMAQNLWDASKAILRGKFIPIQLYLQKWEKHQTNNLSLHRKQLEKEQKVSKLVKEGNHKDQSRNKWKRNEDNNSKDQ